VDHAVLFLTPTGLEGGKIVISGGDSELALVDLAFFQSGGERVTARQDVAGRTSADDLVDLERPHRCSGGIASRGQIGLRGLKKTIAIRHHYRTTRAGQQLLIWINIALCRPS